MSLQKPLLRARARTFGSLDPDSPPPPRIRDAWSHAHQHVRLRVNFYNVSSIEVARHRFDCDLFLEASWTDRGALKLGRSGQSGINDAGVAPENSMVGGLAPTSAWEQPPFNRASNAGKLWTPRLRVRNMLAQAADADNEEWYTVYYRDESGQQLESPIVCQKRRISGTFYEHFELAAYPWDAQDLTISIQSDIAVETEGTLDDSIFVSRIQLNSSNPKWRSIAPLESEFVLQDEYTISPTVFGFEYLSHPHRSAGGRRYPGVEVCAKVTRMTHFYRTSMMEPLAIFVSLSFTSLLIDHNNLADRLQIALSMVLTAAAYKLVCAEQVPKIGFETALGSYVRHCFWAIGLVALCNCLAAVWPDAWTSGAIVNELIQGVTACGFSTPYAAECAVVVIAVLVGARVARIPSAWLVPPIACVVTPFPACDSVRQGIRYVMDPLMPPDVLLMYGFLFMLREFANLIVNDDKEVPTLAALLMSKEARPFRTAKETEHGVCYETEIFPQQRLQSNKSRTWYVASTSPLSETDAASDAEVSSHGQPPTPRTLIRPTRAGSEQDITKARPNALSANRTFVRPARVVSDTAQFGERESTL